MREKEFKRNQLFYYNNHVYERTTTTLLLLLLLSLSIASITDTMKTILPSPPPVSTPPPLPPAPQSPEKKRFTYECVSKTFLTPTPPPAANAEYVRKQMV